MWQRKATTLFLLVTACKADRLVEPVVTRSIPIQAPHPQPRSGGQALKPLVAVDSAIVRSMVVTFRKVATPTYDGSGQAVHPSVIECMGGFWMLMTPYAGSNSGLENPSILKGTSDTSWKDAPNVKNPLVPPGYLNYNSDPDSYCDEAGGKLYVLYRVANKDSNIVKLFAFDGKKVDSATIVLSGPSHDIVSPSFTIGPDGARIITYVKTGKDGCTARKTEVVYVEVLNWQSAKDMHEWKFGPEHKVDVVQPGFVIWHLERHYIPALSKFVMPFAAYPVKSGGQYGACVDNALFIATGTKSQMATYPQPLMWQSNPWLPVMSLYRTSIRYDAETCIMRVWTSYMADYDVWWIGYFSFRWHEAITALEEARVNTGFASASYQRHVATSNPKFLLGDPP